LPSSSASDFNRRRLLWAAGATGLGLGASTGALFWEKSRHVSLPLFSDTVGIIGRSARVLIPPGGGHLLFPRSRVVRAASNAAELVGEEERWISSSKPLKFISPEYQGMLQDALLDIRALTLPGGVSVAGWSANWRYVWPRDAAHMVAALASVGKTGDALSILQFLQKVQRPDLWFEARYTMDGAGPPDQKPKQLDAIGWILWCAGALHSSLMSIGEPEKMESVGPLLRRCLKLTLSVIDNQKSFPVASPDYWEVSESELTLGTVAPLLAGLEAAAKIYTEIGDNGRKDAATEGAFRLSLAIEKTFGSVGYSRHISGGDRDAAVAFLLSPYRESIMPGSIKAFGLAGSELLRSAGGLAPGAGWKNDGISWTPQTALFALVSAHLKEGAADRKLSWLGEHRTAAGSYPEKVLYDGRPAAVAPLGWTAALVALTLVQIDRNNSPNETHPLASAPATRSR
jgi:glucoamylase